MLLCISGMGQSGHGEIQSLSHCTEPVASPGNSHIPFLQLLPGILLVLFNSHTNFIEPLPPHPAGFGKHGQILVLYTLVSISSTHKIWSWAVPPNTGPRTLQSCLNPVIFGITSSSELCTGANLSPDLLCKPCRSQKGWQRCQMSTDPNPHSFFPYREKPAAPFSCDSSTLPARVSPKPQSAEPC